MSTTYTPNSTSAVGDLLEAGFKVSDQIVIEGPFKAGTVTGVLTGARTRGFQPRELSDPLAKFATEIIVEINGRPMRVQIRKADRITKVES